MVEYYLGGCSLARVFRVKASRAVKWNVRSGQRPRQRSTACASRTGGAAPAPVPASALAGTGSRCSVANNATPRCESLHGRVAEQGAKVGCPPAWSESIPSSDKPPVWHAGAGAPASGASEARGDSLRPTGRIHPDPQPRPIFQLSVFKVSFEPPQDARCAFQGTSLSPAVMHGFLKHFAYSRATRAARPV